MSDDAIQDVANMIQASGQNRSQRRKIVKDLGKVENIMEHVKKKAFKKYEAAADDHMRLFFGILGILLVKNYGWKNEEGCEQVEEIFDILNTYLTEYQEYSVDEVCKICEDVTGIQLVGEK